MKMIDMFWAFLVTVILLNGASILVIKMLAGSWPYVGDSYWNQQSNITNRLSEHNYPHPFIGYTRTGNSDLNYPINEKNIFWDIYTTSGFNENHHPTLLILGGSVAMHMSNNKSDFASRDEHGRDALARVIRDKYPGSEFRILNAAYGGYKQPQQYFKMLYLELLDVDFDIVINIDGFNEIALPFAENLGQEIPSIFPRSYFRMVTAYSNSSCLSDRASLSSKIDPIPFMELIKFILRNRCQNSVFQPTSPKKIEFDSSDEIKVASDSSSTWIKSSNLMAKHLMNISKEYIHVIQPNQYLTGSKIFTKREESEFKNQSLYGAPIERFYGKLEANDLVAGNVIDLRYLFLDEKAEVYRDNCCHMNDYGMTEISKAIVDRLPTLFDNLFIDHN